MMKATIMFFIFILPGKLVLHSMIGGRWGGEKRLSSGYDFTPDKEVYY